MYENVICIFLYIYLESIVLKFYIIYDFIFILYLSLSLSMRLAIYAGVYVFSFISAWILHMHVDVVSEGALTKLNRTPAFANASGDSELKGIIGLPQPALTSIHQNPPRRGIGRACNFQITHFGWFPLSLCFCQWWLGSSAK